MSEEERIRAHVAAGTCPFCPAGPFAMLPVHTSKVHGVDRYALRDLAGLTGQDPLCSPEVLDKLRAAYDPERGEAARAAGAAHRAAGTHKRPQYSRVGRERQVANLRAYMDEHPDRYRSSLELAHKNSAKARKK